MWSSAAVVHLLQGCVFRDGILHTLVVTSDYLSYCVRACDCNCMYFIFLGLNGPNALRGF